MGQTARAGAKRRTIGAGQAIGADGSPVFVAVSQFTVANGAPMTRAVKEAFRLHVVDDVEGFLRMEVISPLDNPAEIWLITFWRDEACFEAWHRSHHYKDAHQAIPKGLKLVRGSFKLRYFEHISS